MDCVNKLSDVDISLSQGQLYSAKNLVILWLGAISSSLLIAVGIISFVFSCIEWDGVIFFVACMSFFFGIGLLAFFVYLFVRDKKIKKKVVLWLEDAVKTTAYSSKIDEWSIGFYPSVIKICVKFSLNGLTYSRESSGTNVGGKPGYLGVFKRYADKEISILYSPKYDEVLILKATEHELSV